MNQEIKNPPSEHCARPGGYDNLSLRTKDKMDYPPSSNAMQPRMSIFFTMSILFIRLQNAMLRWETVTAQGWREGSQQTIVRKCHGGPDRVNPRDGQNIGDKRQFSRFYGLLNAPVCEIRWFPAWFLRG